MLTEDTTQMYITKIPKKADCKNLKLQFEEGNFWKN